MADSTAPPPSSGTIRRRSTTIDPDKTFGIYINHVRNAAIILGHDDAWLTPEVRLIAKGGRNAQEKSFAFPNFIMTSDVMRIILDQGWQSNIGVISYLPNLFSLRAPSETLQLTVANPNGELLKCSPQVPKALIGHRTYRNTTALVIKFRFRKNVGGSCILIRPCLFAMVSPPNRTFCPIHGFWATNRGRLTPGSLLFPNTSTNNFDQRLKRVTRDLNYEDGHRYPPPFLPQRSYARDPQLRTHIPDHPKIGNLDLRRLQMLPRHTRR